MLVILSISPHLSCGVTHQCTSRTPQNTPVQSRDALTETPQNCEPSEQTVELTVIDVVGVEKLKRKKQTGINKNRNYFRVAYSIPGLRLRWEELG